MSNKFIRFIEYDKNVKSYGLIDGDIVYQLERAPWFGTQRTGKEFNIKNISMSSPVEPSKIICIGLNYHAHIEASYTANKTPKEPLIFLKPTSAIIGPDESIVYPQQAQRVDYEAELGVIISRKAKNVKVNEAMDYIFGFTCVNDVTARDLQKKDGQWSRAKGFDTFCPVGPWVVNDINYQDVLVEGILNDEVKQSGRTSQMIFKIPFLVSYISSIMTLYPGDLIATGTPAGIAPMKPGDKIEVRIEQIGSLINRVV